MKYHFLKNIFIASLLATIYWSNLIAHLPLLDKLAGTTGIFVAMVVLLTDADQYFAKKKKQPRKERNKEHGSNI